VSIAPVLGEEFFRHLHYNHPLLVLGEKLCFESGQQKLDELAVTVYHLRRKFHLFLQGPLLRTTGPKTDKS
jgi:hypothetical protein